MKQTIVILLLGVSVACALQQVVVNGIQSNVWYTVCDDDPNQKGTFNCNPANPCVDNVGSFKTYDGSEYVEFFMLCDNPCESQNVTVWTFSDSSCKNKLAVFGVNQYNSTLYPGRCASFEYPLNGNGQRYYIDPKCATKPNSGHSIVPLISLVCLLTGGLSLYL